MPILLALVFSALMLAGCIGAGSVSTVERVNSSDAMFPIVSGVNLQGEEIALPNGFEGRLNVVAVAFERRQQAAVDTWITAMRKVRAEYDNVAFYEVPTIYEGNPVFRMWVNNGMRAGIPDPEARNRTITLYLDRDEFTDALDIPDMSDIHVLLLDDDGRILWRAIGSADLDKVESLKRSLAPLV